ncbi:unnamed protein product [Calypogeia fissa]
MPIASIDGADMCKVWEIKTLGLVRDADARMVLEDIAKQVQPIMRKRKWKVPLLSEFCPQNPSLLGLNIDGGREIRIRLRRHPDDPQFYDYEATLGTMLHELTHIQCGPHNSAFYKLLGEVTEECEELMMKGIKGTGQGFDTRGQRLGGFKRNPPPTSVRQVALAAAEKRAQIWATMPSGPRRVGGDSDIMNALSPVQAAAMAAERRLRDDTWCAAPVTAGGDGVDRARERESSSGSNDKAGVTSNNSATKENRGVRENSQGGALEGTDSGRVKGGDVSSSSRRVGGSGGGLVLGEQPVTGSSRRAGHDVGGSQSNPIHISDGVGPTSQEASLWECQVCTLLNKPVSVTCEACAVPRMQASTKDSKSWTCKFCTLRNAESLSNCGACNQWRYSYGAPTASRGPYVGT